MSPAPLPLPGPLRFARMAGSSIAAPSSAPWMTDFLNAAYYARPEEAREVSDLRLAHGIVTSRWAGLDDRRLGAADVLALHRAFGAARLRGRGRLDREALLAGSRTLIGDWFPEAWADPTRRRHGIAFADATQARAFAAERRLRRSALGPLTSPGHDPGEQHWATYDAVALPDSDAALALLEDPARWPDIGCASGRFTALRSRGLEGQTFEIEVVAEPAPRSPIFTRGYVTCTTAALSEGSALDAGVASLLERYAAGAGPGAEPPLPEGARPLALIVLTTHDGHFLGRALSHLLVFDEEGQTWIRDVGAWDPLPAHLQAAYYAAGRSAQREFWGPRPRQRSMLAQLAMVTAPSS